MEKCECNFRQNQSMEIGKRKIGEWSRNKFGENCKKENLGGKQIGCNPLLLSEL